MQSQTLLIMYELATRRLKYWINVLI